MRRNVYSEKTDDLDGYRTSGLDRNCKYRYSESFAEFVLCKGAEYRTGYLIPYGVKHSLLFYYSSEIEKLNRLFFELKLKQAYLYLYKDVAELLNRSLKKTHDDGEFLVKLPDVYNPEDKRRYWCAAVVLPVAFGEDVFRKRSSLEYVVNAFNDLQGIQKTFSRTNEQFEEYLTGKVMETKPNFLSLYFQGGHSFGTKQQLKYLKVDDGYYLRYLYGGNVFNLFFGYSSFWEEYQYYVRLPYYDLVYKIMKAKNVDKFRKDYPALCSTFDFGNDLVASTETISDKKEHVLKLRMAGSKTFGERLRKNDHLLIDEINRYVQKTIDVSRDLERFIKTDQFKNYLRQIKNKTFKAEQSAWGDVARAGALVYRIVRLVAAFNGVGGGGGNDGMDKAVDALSQVDFDLSCIPDLDGLANIDFGNLDFGGIDIPDMDLDFDIPDIDADLPDIDFDLPDFDIDDSCFAGYDAGALQADASLASVSDANSSYVNHMPYGLSQRGHYKGNISSDSERLRANVENCQNRLNCLEKELKDLETRKRNLKGGNVKGYNELCKEIDNVNIRIQKTEAELKNAKAALNAA